MADFHQQGMIADLHGLHEIVDQGSYLTALESRLMERARNRPLALLLPVHISEIHAGKALGNIIKEIAQVPYLRRIVIALGGTDRQSDFHSTRDYFGKLQKAANVKVIWIEGPELQEVLGQIRNQGMNIGCAGKGQSVWVALGYILAQNDCELIALHDCDVLTYDRILLGRLFLPLVGNHGFQFCKGYYPRLSPTERVMKGRVARLFLIPFLAAMKAVTSKNGSEELARFFDYHLAFKYPLAGEVSFTADLGRSLDFASDWGLEVAMLAETYHRLPPSRVAQVSLSRNYEHRHQDISPLNPRNGLHKIVMDIAAFYFNYLRSRGFPHDESFIDLICRKYEQEARSFIDLYAADAEINFLDYDYRLEATMATHFKLFLREAFVTHKFHSRSPVLPAWDRVSSSLPAIYARLTAAVEEDNCRTMRSKQKTAAGLKQEYKYI
jgi:glucosyl-3-phosphoglycerate synthase